LHNLADDFEKALNYRQTDRNVCQKCSNIIKENIGCSILTGLDLQEVIAQLKKGTANTVKSNFQSLNGKNVRSVRYTGRNINLILKNLGQL